MTDTDQTTYIEVVINGVTYNDAEDVSTQFGTDAISGRIQVKFPNKRSAWDYGHAFEVWGGSVDSRGLLGRGYIVTFDDGYARDACKNPVMITATNNGEKLQLPYQGDTGGADKDYAGQTREAIITNIAESMGIPPSQHHIEGDGHIFGTLSPVPWRNGEAGYPLVQKLDEARGYLTFCGRDGVLYSVPWNGIPATSGAFTLTEGGNLRSIERTASVQGMYNRVIVRGAAYEDVEIEAIREIANARVPDPPGYITYTYQNELIETVVDADELAQYLLNQLNRVNVTYSATCDGIAELTPGMTVNVVCARLGIAGESFFVQHVAQHVSRSTQGKGDFESRLTLIGGYASDILIEPLPPTAMLALSAFREYIDGEGFITVIVADGSASYGPASTITEYAWSTSPAAEPATATTTTPFFTCYVPEATTSVTVTLIVTDSNAATGTASRTITIDVATLPAETIWLAANSEGRVTQTGGPPWAVQASPGGDVNVLAPFGASWGMLFGTSAGWVMTSEDFLAATWTTAVQPHEPGVACTAVWVTEQAEDRLWAAFADGAVYASTDRGQTWEARGTIPGTGPVPGIQEAVGGSGTLRAMRDTVVFISEDEGVSWDEVEDVGATATRLAFGFDRDFVGTDGGTPLVNDLKDEGDPTVPGGTGGVRGLTMGWKTKKLYMADDSGKVFATDTDLAAFSQVGWTNGIANHLVRSGNEEGVLYAATDQGFEKSVDMGANFFISDFPAENIAMVGFGSLANVEAVLPPGYLLMGLSTRTYDQGLLARYTEADGWTKINGPAAFGAHSIYVAALSVNPFNQLEWLVEIRVSGQMGVWGSTRMIEGAAIDISPLWMTLDGGTSWIEIDIPRSSSETIGAQSYGPYIAWSDTVTDQWSAGTHAADRPRVLVGTNAVQVGGPYPGSYYVHEIVHTATYYGRLVPFAGVNEWGGNIGLIVTYTDSSADITPRFGSLNGFGDDVKRYPGTSRACVSGRSGSRYAYWADYQTGPMIEKTMPGETLTIYPTADGVYTISGAVFGEIINVGGVGSAFVPITPPGFDSGVEGGFFGISMDPLSRQHVAIATQQGQFVYIYDTATSTFVTIPPCDVDAGEITLLPAGAGLWLVEGGA